ncbi:nicotinate-nucleotide--dimethylbenzimidazole phosphoribosyltransferase [Croceicoccus naphthovorans]|uniref:Nicotinate-nucleotide--dimethylbenzimidazole phosphoribosyltransferase n=1 Tax=Croceicoccus naphthovorans TaxID=1348774 RepID=A0A0G3XH65_9SPHN|nr:nicotinate-nucleotide--dimethylbenzimidazole phosphoribosyltransferase [Croceicoccus naphthovorans]AKM09981.1 nicotinate-nucleotide--dimethylbenzimidazole phosphoribosyltransferase [Croceicoccus naphthovorans]MBB3991150.1 nicotinate-nucleotide--dimethylbenzimidazole phosphoribosyltransferase [Croceicoccus naphthovorans]
MTFFATADAFTDALHSLPAPDLSASAAAEARQAQLTKPAGSLGRLEEIAVFMAQWQGNPRPRADRIAAVIFAGNHGCAVQGISAFPPEVTEQMVANFRDGGAAINALTHACGASLDVIALDLNRPTADISYGPAMSEGECLDALNSGAAAVSGECDLLLPGEMGIGNTTPAAALCAASFGGGAASWVGRGTGVDDATFARKRHLVARALVLHEQHCTSAFEALRRLGGREIVAMAGAMLAARQKRIPVMLDGFIACSAIAPLAREVPGIVDHCLAAHQSGEGAHGRLLAALRLQPLLALDMRLGEGSGAAVAAQIVRSALSAHDRMATFAEAAVAGVP